MFNEEAPKYNFTTDISTNETDVITGDAWLEFMCKCKYFIGTEGGSTVIDRDGLIFKAGTEYQKKILMPHLKILKNIVLLEWTET